MSVKEFNESKGFIEVLLAFFLAGSSVVACKMLSSHIPVFLTTSISLLAGLSILLPIQGGKIKEIKKLSRVDFLSILLQGLSGVVLTRVLTLEGLKYISGLNAGIINSSIPCVMIILSRILLKEKSNIRGYIGVIITVAGMLTITVLGGTGEDSSFSVVGTLLLLGAVICEVLMTIFRKKSERGINSLLNTTLLFIVSFIILIPFTINDLRFFSFTLIYKTDWLILLYYGFIGSALAYILWGRGVQKVSSAKVGIGFSMIPLTVILLSILLLKESFTIYHILGGGICLTGMVFSSITKKEQTVNKDSCSKVMCS